MNESPERTCIAFHGQRLVARGALRDVALATKALVDHEDPAGILLFDAATSAPVEVDFRGTPEEVLARLPLPAPAAGSPVEEEADEGPRAPGRPRLGVVAREVTLLPRHWEWLASRPGGASVTLRRLVEAARKAGAEEDRRSAARESAFRFMNAMAGNEEGFEEACRALFAPDRARFEAAVAAWPSDVRDHALGLAEGSFGDGSPAA